MIFTYISRNRERAVADAFRPLRTHQCYLQLSGELHKSEVLLIASTLLVVKAHLYEFLKAA